LGVAGKCGEEKEMQEGLTEQAMILQGQYPDREAEGKRRQNAAFSFI
jgi:hypothetical protein